MADEPFYIGDDDRFGRFRLIGWWDQRRLAAAKVLVIGAGALGNEVVKNLALLGVGNVVIVDLDEIEASNLSRSVLFRASDRGRPKAEVAAAAARDLHPEISVVGLRANVITDVGLGVFRDADVVIGCLDNREARLWVNQCCWKVGTPWIDAGIQEISGVMKVFTPPTSSCYECGMTDNDYRLINLRYSCPLLKRDDILAGKVPTAPTISSILAGLQTQEALKLLHGLPVDAGSALVFHGGTNTFYKTAIPPREDCLSHVSFDPVVALPLTAERTTAAELIDAVSSPSAPGGRGAGGEGSIRPIDVRTGDAPQPAFGHLLSSEEGSEGIAFPGDAGPASVRLGRDLVVSMTWDETGVTRDVFRPLAAVSHRDSLDERGRPGRPTLTHVVGRSDDLAGRTLRDLGVPDYDIVTVVGGGRETHVLLAGDAGRLAPFTGDVSRP